MLSSECPCGCTMSTTWCVWSMCDLVSFPFILRHAWRKFDYRRVPGLCIVLVIDVFVDRLCQVFVLVSKFFPLVAFLRRHTLNFLGFFQVTNVCIQRGNGTLIGVVRRSYSFLPLFSRRSRVGRPSKTLMAFLVVISTSVPASWGYLGIEHVQAIVLF